MVWFKHLSGIAALGCIALSASPAVARDRDISGGHGVLRLEDQYLASRMSGDPSVVQRVFADDGVFIRENGDERAKSAYQADFHNEVRWTSFSTTERVIRLYGNAAVTHAILYVRAGADTAVARLRTTAVYTRGAKGWQIVSWQATPLADVRDAAKP